MKLLIKGGRVIDPSERLDRVADLLIEDGRVASVGEGLDAEGAETFDASGLVVAPGFIDLHVHLREPGEEYKETIASGPPQRSRADLPPSARCPIRNP